MKRLTAADCLIGAPPVVKLRVAAEILKLPDVTAKDAAREVIESISDVDAKQLDGKRVEPAARPKAG